MKKVISLSVFTTMTLSILMGCSNDEPVEQPKEEVTKKQFIETYTNIVSANYNDSYNTAVTMKTKIDAFITDPSENGLKEAKQAWLYARDFYGQTEAFREANGPIDNEDLLGTEGQINAWPLDESYIDYVSDNKGGNVQNGLIGNTAFAINEANLISKNEDGKEDNISTGWHAIEFLLWGQDLNYDPVTHKLDNFTSAGNRPFTDYTTADFAARRIEYLKVVTNLLIKDLKDLKDTWAQGGSYRTKFLALNEDIALKNILNGIGFIANGEVALERLDPAIDEGQENEHSCFSDNTKQDMWANVNGINNIIVGSYTKEDGSKITGASLIGLTATIDKNASNDLKEKAQLTLNKLNALLNINKAFDAIISEETLGSNGPAGQLSSALKDEGKAIAEAANKLGVNISIN